MSIASRPDRRYATYTSARYRPNIKHPGRVGQGAARAGYPASRGRVVLGGQVDREPIDEVAGKIGFRDVGTLRQFMRLTTLPDDLQRLVTWGRQPGMLSFTVASEIARARSSSGQRWLAILSIQNGWSKSEVQKALRNRSENDG